MVHMTSSAPGYLILNKILLPLTDPQYLPVFLCRTYMDMRSQATTEWLNEWYLEHAQSSKQEDGSSCGDLF